MAPRLSHALLATLAVGLKAEVCPQSCVQALGLSCPKVCAGKTASGDDMTCSLDLDCTDSKDPYGGLGCDAGDHGRHCRFCGFSSDGTKYPPCAGSADKPTATLASAFSPTATLAKADPSSSCPTICLAALGLYCPKVCAGKTAAGDDMTCVLDHDCLDPMTDPYGGLGCGGGGHGQDCRFCGFEADGILYPPCAGSKLAAIDLVQAATTSSTATTSSATSVPMVLLGFALLASVGAAAISLQSRYNLTAISLKSALFAGRRGGVESGVESELLSAEAASEAGGSGSMAGSGSWPAPEESVSAESDYVRFGK